MIIIKKEFKYTIEYMEEGNYLECECKKFEIVGILCCHIFIVMSKKDIRVINKRYMLRKWRKDVHRRHSKIFFAGGYPNMTDEYKRYKELQDSFN